MSARASKLYRTDVQLCDLRRCEAVKRSRPLDAAQQSENHALTCGDGLSATICAVPNRHSISGSAHAFPRKQGKNRPLQQTPQVSQGPTPKRRCP